MKALRIIFFKILGNAFIPNVFKIFNIKMGINLSILVIYRGDLLVFISTPRFMYIQFLPCIKIRHLFLEILFTQIITLILYLKISYL